MDVIILTMKKVLLLLILALPLAMVAREKNDSKYLKGAVTEKNGVVVFSKSFKVPGMSDAELVNGMKHFVKDSLVAGGIKDAWTRMLTGDDSKELVSARVEEWLVFTKRFLYLDQTRLRYQINIAVANGSVDMEVTQISYLYGEEWKENKPTGIGGENYRAEGWIDDASALNKAGTKVLPLSGKFRRKTVDRMEGIFESAMDMFEQKLVEKSTKGENKKDEPKRKFVID